MTNLKQEYQKLEEKFLQYSDLTNIEIKENWEEFVIVPELNNLWAQYFNNRLKKIIEENPLITDNQELIEIAHRWAAFTEVAGHPTGWAVDVTLFDLETQDFLDFWTNPWNYSTKKCYLNSPEITKKQRKNGKLLQELMKQEWFSPYLWEW